MLLASLGAPDSGFYIQQLVVRCPERMDTERLLRAWTMVAEGHDVLRAGLRWGDAGEPEQEFLPPGQAMVTWGEHEIGDQGGRESELSAFLEADRRRGLELDAGVPWRVHVLNASDCSDMVWTFHHLLLDGRSHTRVLREVFELYDMSGEMTLRPAQSDRTFREYLDWLHAQGDLCDGQFWQSMLGGRGRKTSFRPVGLSDGGEVAASGHCTCVFSETETRELEALALRCDVTLNALLQASWARVLGLYSQSSSVVFGTTRAGRYWDASGEARESVGLFVNTLPFGVSVEPEQVICEWLTSVRQRQLSLRAHEQTSLTRIAASLGAANAKALFDTILVFENHDIETVFRHMGGAWGQRTVQLHERLDGIVLSVYADSRLRLVLGFPTPAYSAAQMEIVLGHVRTVLLALLAADVTKARVGDLSAICSEERRRLLDQYAGIRVPFPDTVALHRLIEEQVNRAPEHCAMEFPEGTMSYRELNARANRLARHIRRSAPEGQAPVGVCMDIRPELVVAMLAVLKSGNVYVPLDPASPMDRLRFYLQDSGVRVLVTCGELRANLPAEFDGVVICLDREATTIAREADGDLGDAVGPDDLLYLLYTSGSTGTPKGVLAEHRALCNVVNEQIRLFGVAPADRIAQLSAPGFDASLFEMVMALRAGATLCLGTWQERQPGPGLVEFLARKRVTNATLTPTLLRALPLYPLPDLRVLICCGESCAPELVRQWAPGRRFFNLYGPTEGTIWASCEECFEASRELPSIGRPIGNLRLYVLDPWRNPVPHGVPGELYIGGVGVARGYLDRPELNAERFVPDPFVPVGSGARMYRTGDWVRFLPDGRVDFIGRMDDQVKIRGIRMELGEIESLLRKHPAVSAAAVVLHGGEPHAFVRPAEGRMVVPTDLRTELAKELSLPLIPASFTVLDELPRTLSGKADRQRLASLLPTGKLSPSPGASADAGPAREDLEAVPVLSEDMRHRVLYEWNRTDAVLPESCCAHELFEAQAARTPHALAVHDAGGERISYGELDTAADRLASQLLGLGLGHEEPVVAVLDRGIAAVTAFLAVLKAGATFVPLDSGIPRHRLDFALADTKAGIVLTTRDHARRLGPMAGTVICLDEDQPVREGAPVAPPLSGPGQRAYIIYTSGSTGEPKGVEIEHRSLVNLMVFYRRRLGLTPADRSSQVASTAFDASVADIWPYLGVGASVFVPGQEILSDPEALADWLGREGITVSFLPTALAERVFGIPGLQKGSLRFLLTGGDRLRSRPPRGLSFSVINTYGPTENTVDSTWAVVAPEGTEDGPPPIGRPIDNVKAYILSPDGTPVPPGVKGELFLGGVQVARSYLGRSALSARCFVATPFDAESAPRLYRTGDVVRYREDGVIEFIGRLDGQVQVRGFRVELGEIEAAMVRQENVREAVAELVEGDGSVRGIAGYVVASDGTESPTLGARVQDALRNELPSYMVPLYVSVLPCMPRSAGGKVDRARLPRKGVFAERTLDAAEQPATETERRMARVWEKVLSIRGVGRNDNFFDLGGHSLMVLNLVASIRQEWQCRLPVSTVLQRSTLRELSEALDGRLDTKSPALPECVVPLREDGAGRPVFCVPGAGGGSNQLRGLASRLAIQAPFYGLEPLGLPSEVASSRSIEAIAREFVKAVRIVQPAGPYRLGGYSFGGEVAYEMTQQLLAAGEEVDDLFMIDTCGPGKRFEEVERLADRLHHLIRLPFREKIPFVYRYIRRLMRRFWKGNERPARTVGEGNDDYEELTSIMLEQVRAARAYRARPMDRGMLLIRVEDSLPGTPLQPQMGWEKLMKGTIEMVSVPGSHLTILREPNCAEVARALNRRLG